MAMGKGQGLVPWPFPMAMRCGYVPAGPKAQSWLYCRWVRPYLEAMAFHSFTAAFF